MQYRLHDIDPIGLSMEWLEICKSGQASALADLYTESARFECECEGASQLLGRELILQYWRPRLTSPPPRPFKLEQIWPEPAGIALVYSYLDQPRVRVSFEFDGRGKIERSRCRLEPWLPFAPATWSELGANERPHRGKRQRT